MFKLILNLYIVFNALFGITLAGADCSNFLPMQGESGFLLRRDASGSMRWPGNNFFRYGHPGYGDDGNLFYPNANRLMYAHSGYNDHGTLYWPNGQVMLYMHDGYNNHGTIYKPDGSVWYLRHAGYSDDQILTGLPFQNFTLTANGIKITVSATVTQDGSLNLNILNQGDTWSFQFGPFTTTTSNSIPALANMKECYNGGTAISTEDPNDLQVIQEDSNPYFWFNNADNPAVSSYLYKIEPLNALTQNCQGGSQLIGNSAWLPRLNIGQVYRLRVCGVSNTGYLSLGAVVTFQYISGTTPFCSTFKPLQGENSFLMRRAASGSMNWPNGSYFRYGHPGYGDDGNLFYPNANRLMYAHPGYNDHGTLYWPNGQVMLYVHDGYNNHGTIYKPDGSVWYLRHAGYSDDQVLTGLPFQEYISSDNGITTITSVSINADGSLNIEHEIYGNPWSYRVQSYIASVSSTVPADLSFNECWYDSSNYPDNPVAVNITTTANIANVTITPTTSTFNSGYIYKYQLGSIPSSCSGGTLTSALSFSLTNLQASQTIGILVCGVNDSGLYSSGLGKIFQTSTAVVAPLAPIVTLSSRALSSIDLFLSSGVGSSTVISYKIDYVLSGSATPNCTNGISVNSNSTTLSNLLVNRAYQISVCAVGTTGLVSNATSQIFSTDTDAPSAVTAIRVQGITASAASIVWQGVQTTTSKYLRPVTYLVVVRSFSNSNIGCTSGRPVNSVLPQAFNGLSEGAEYEATVCTVNDMGEYTRGPWVYFKTNNYRLHIDSILPVISGSSKGMRVSWPSIAAGAEYILESTDVLGGAWQGLSNGKIRAMDNGVSKIYLDDYGVSTTGNRFYRLGFVGFSSVIF